MVDNASSDASVEYVESAFPEVKIVALSENTGFTGGNIEGLKYAGGDYIMLVNNDVVIDSDCIQNLAAAIESRPDIGIGAPKMIVYGKDIIDSAGDGFSTSFKGFKRGEGMHADNYNDEEYVFGACAGAAIYRKSMIDEIGFFDEDFFLIYEDTDLNFRAQLAGWRALYVPSAVAYHRVRSTIGNLSDMAVYYSLRNSELVRLKNMPCLLFMRHLHSFILGIVLDFLYFCIKHGKIKLYFKAKIDALKLMPKMINKRRQIMSKKKANNKYLISLMTTLFDKDFFVIKVKKFFYK